jgi:hypothetical protein
MIFHIPEPRFFYFLFFLKKTEPRFKNEKLSFLFHLLYISGTFLF